jgi:hypothetical protein
MTAKPRCNARSGTCGVRCATYDVSWSASAVAFSVGLSRGMADLRVMPLAHDNIAHHTSHIARFRSRTARHVERPS